MQRHDDAGARLREVIARAQACRLCPSMEGRRRVLSPLNGLAEACVLFVAEAPGRLGGEVTGVPLSRDASGQRFEKLLALAGLSRADVFITNTVLCNPRDAQGRNRPPTREEQRHCAAWLAAQLDAVRAPLVVTLGAVALAALYRITPHGLHLASHVAQPTAWHGRTLVPLYHPSPRAGLSRPYAVQESDWRRLGELVAIRGLSVPIAHPPVSASARTT